MIASWSITLAEILEQPAALERTFRANFAKARRFRDEVSAARDFRFVSCW